MKHSTEATAILIDYDNLSRNHLAKMDYIFRHKTLAANVKIKKAYAYWRRYGNEEIKQLMHYAVDQIWMPPFNNDGKNGCDIRLAIDAMEFYFDKGVQNFIIVSGDSDYIPLYKKLRELGLRLTVFSNENAIGEFTQGFIDELILFPGKKKTSTAEPSKKEARQVKSIFTVLSLIKKEWHYASLDQVTLYLNASKKKDPFKAKGMIKSARHQKIIKKKLNPMVFEIAEVYQWNQIDAYCYSLLIHMAVRAKSKKLGFLIDHFHRKGIQVLAQELLKTPVGDTTALVDTSLLLLGKGFDPKWILILLNILYEVQIIKLMNKEKQYQLIESMSESEIIAVHNNYIRKVCIESEINLSEKQWGAIFNNKNVGI